MEIKKMLTLSTGHLTEKSLSILDKNASDYNIDCYKKQDDKIYGYYIYITSADALSDDCPSDIKDVISYAVKHGCSVIELDCDAQRLDSLPYYEDAEN